MYVGIASGHIKLLSPRLPSKSLFLLDENMSRFASRIVQFYSRRCGWCYVVLN